MWTWPPRGGITLRTGLGPSLDIDLAVGGGSPHHRLVAARVVARDSSQVQLMVENGTGIGLLSVPLVAQAVRDGNLIDVLPGFSGCCGSFKNT